MITAIMFGIFLIFLGVGVPIAASVGWATLSVNLLDPSFACDAIYFVKTMANGMRTVRSSVQCLFLFLRQSPGGSSNRSCYHVPVLWCNLRFRPSHCGCDRHHVYPVADKAWL